MEVVTGVTNSLLPRLGALLQDEYKLQDKVKKDIESLQNELIFMRVTLRMVAEVPRDQLDEHVRIWSVFIRELSYDMEDVVNTFFARVQVTPHLVGLIKKAFNMLCMGRTHHEIAGMVKEIRSLINEVAGLRDRYRLDNIVTRSATPVVLPQRDNTFVGRYLEAEYKAMVLQPVAINHEQPVGVDGDMKVLRTWITSGDSHHSMVIIHGAGGLGKSTIAMALYREYGDHFQRRAMLNVSQDGDAETALVDILSQIKPRELQNHNGDSNKINAELRESLQGRSIFPRGQNISRKRLTRRWISDGFVIEQQGLSVEKVAETYLNHLIRRKFLLAMEHSSNGEVKSYQVIHDKVLEYIVSKASEENFVTAIGGCGVAPPSTKVRRLSAKYNGYSKYEKELEIMNLSHVRDVTIFGSLKQLPSSSFKFGVVQVLDLEGCMDFKQQHIKEICKMILLKYLSLRRTDIKKLTKRIGDLQYLETLDMRETGIVELPKAICKLERLVNMFGGNKRTRKALKIPKKLGKRKNMKALQILTGIEIGEETTADLRHLTNLRKLAIYKINNNKEGTIFEVLRSSIEFLGGCSLCALVIHDESAEFLKSLGQLPSPPKFLNALELSGKLVELPKWITELDALTKLTLSVTALRADNLELLSKICSLFSLTFSLHAAKQDQETADIVEENKACSDGVILFPVGRFQNLKLLRFFAPYVPQLSFPDGALPTLERLDLRFSNFEGIVGIKELKNLQQVHIKVYDEASETTETIIKAMATEAREDREGPRIIFD